MILNKNFKLFSILKRHICVYTFSLYATFIFAQTSTWNGASSTHWDDAANWTFTGGGSLSNANTAYAIPSNETGPTTSAGDAFSAKLINLGPGATATIPPNLTLTVAGLSGNGLLISGVMINNGILSISQASQSGIRNGGAFTNNGTININNTGTDGITNIGVGIFHNYGSIHCGFDGNIGDEGINNFEDFYNYLGAEINIDDSAEAGIYNADGIFENSGSIHIGQNPLLGEVGLEGILNDASFTNTQTGILNIDNTGLFGVFNSSGSTIDNSGRMNIGVTGGVDNIVNNGFQNEGSTTNNSQGYMRIANVTGKAFNNIGTLTNNGLIGGDGEFDINGDATGTIIPGPDNGKVYFDSDQVFDVNSHINFLLSTPTDSICLEVNGVATFNGIITVDFFYETLFGDRFLILKANSFSGTIGIANSLPSDWILDTSISGEVWIIREGSQWTGTVDSDWHRADNWKPIGIPTTTSNVVIPSQANDPVISDTASAKLIDLKTGADLTVMPNAQLHIDGAEGDGLSISSTSQFENSGSVTIGANASIDGHGISSSGVMLNQATGIIEVLDAGQSGIRSSFSSASFINQGSILIGGPSEMQTGISLSSNSFFQNDTSGVIQINHAEDGFSSFVDECYNDGIIKIGNLEAISDIGILLSKSMKNRGTGSIDIHEVNGSGIVLFGQGDFLNEGTCIIGSTGIQNTGIINNGSINNMSRLEIIHFGEEAIKNNPSGEVYNYDLIEISESSNSHTLAKGNGRGIYSEGTFENADCALLFIHGDNVIETSVVSDGNEFTNYGTIIEDANSAGNIQNNFGIIQDQFNANFTIDSLNDGDYYAWNFGAIWTGCEDSLWTNANNWHSRKVPSSTQVLIAKSDTVIVPTLTNAICATIRIADSSALIIEENAGIEVTFTVSVFGLLGMGIENFGYLENQGTLNVDVGGGAPRSCIYNAGKIKNKGGEIFATGALRHGIDMQANSHFENDTNGVVSIGSGTAGIDSIGLSVGHLGFFQNEGLLNIDRCAIYGIELFGALINYGEINYGQMSDLAKYGMRLETDDGVMLNFGSVELNKTGNGRGIQIDGGAGIGNYSIINIYGDGQSETGIRNNSSLINNGGATLTIRNFETGINNLGSVQNFEDAKIIVDTSMTGIKNPIVFSEFTNAGEVHIDHHEVRGFSANAIISNTETGELNIGMNDLNHQGHTALFINTTWTNDGTINVNPQSSYTLNIASGSYTNGENGIMNIYTGGVAGSVNLFTITTLINEGTMSIYK